MSWYQKFSHIWDDYESTEEESGIFSDLTFKLKDKTIEGRYEICGVTSRYMLVWGEYQLADRIFYLKMDKIQPVPESQIISSSRELKELNYNQFKTYKRWKQD